MTDPIQHLRELLARATPGALESVKRPGVSHAGFTIESRPGKREHWRTIGDVASPADAKLIVAAINALPALLDVAEAARDYTNLRTNGDPQGGRGMTRAAARMEEALAKLEKNK